MLIFINGNRSVGTINKTSTGILPNIWGAAFTAACM